MNSGLLTQYAVVPGCGGRRSWNSVFAVLRDEDPPVPSS